jgi:hypothetical protein
MLSNRWNLLTAVLLACSAIATVVSMIRSSDGIDAGLLAFIAWALSPYVCFFFASTLLQKALRLPYLPIATTVIAVLMLLLALQYLGIPSDTSSTAGLAFVFVPLYMYVGSFLLLTAVTVVMLVLRRIKKA